MEELGEKAKNMTPLQIRQECKKYALKWVETIASSSKIIASGI